MKNNYIELTHLKAYGWEDALRGMRNPLQSWEKNDSSFKDMYGLILYNLGLNDNVTAKRLIKAGPSHRKFLRHIHIGVDINAGLKFFDEFDTYLHTVKNSTSQMHTLGKRLLTPSDFNDNIDLQILDRLNMHIGFYIDAKENKMSTENLKHLWRTMIDNIPSSFRYIRTTTLNYEVFFTMYANRKNHKMEEWVFFCETLRNELPMMDEWMSHLEM